MTIQEKVQEEMSQARPNKAMLIDLLEKTFSREEMEQMDYDSLLSIYVKALYLQVVKE